LIKGVALAANWRAKLNSKRKGEEGEREREKGYQHAPSLLIYVFMSFFPLSSPTSFPIPI
jgi:hypothetical protein